MPPKDKEQALPTFEADVADHYQQPAKAAGVDVPVFTPELLEPWVVAVRAKRQDIPEMEPAEGAEWPGPDPKYYAMVFKTSMIQAYEGLENLMGVFAEGIPTKILPLELALGSYVVAITELMNELQDARHAARQLKRYAEMIDEAK